MPSFFSKLKSKDGPAKVKKGSQKQLNQSQLPPPKPRWEDAWLRKTVEPEEIQELLRGCMLELKSKALDVPFLLLPFRPTSDPSAARTFIRNFFDKGQALHGDYLMQELRLTEPMVLCSVTKWCWSRLAGGVVTWEAYELFRTGEHDSNMARDSFTTFIPLSVDSDARKNIIFDFFDLLAAIAAHGKTNGLGGRKLSRLAGWWAFEHVDAGKGFDGGYKTWRAAANATSHLFFAYLRSLSPEIPKGLSGISTLPRSLQKLLQETEYPPQVPELLQMRTTKVVMIVDSVSPTPFALLRRANHFEYRDDDRALQRFSDYEDPVKALTDECRRVLKSISSANQSQVSNSKESTGLRDASWSRFEDIGFSGSFDEGGDESDDDGNYLKKRKPQGLRTKPQSKLLDLDRPTTPSWADFLNVGFVDETSNGPAPLLLPPDKILPPIDTSRSPSSQSNKPKLESERDLEPGELANITKFDLDDAFWWVWISSLAGEEPAERKGVFGRCALVETVIPGGKWLVMEEMVKGAAPEAPTGAYVAEKKSRFTWTRRGRDKARVSTLEKENEKNARSRSPFSTTQSPGVSKTNIGSDQHARIQAAAAQLQQKQKAQKEREMLENTASRRGRNDIEAASQKTNSIMTLQPVIMTEASPAMKWAKKYDKDAIREAYLADNSAGRGLGLPPTVQTNGHAYPVEDHLDKRSGLQRNPPSTDRDLPAIPKLPEAAPEPEPTPASRTITPSPPPAVKSQQHQPLPEKPIEVASPLEAHPVKIVVGGYITTPRNEQSSFDQVRNEEWRAATNEAPLATNISPDSSPDLKERHNKLQKSQRGGGFRKMFGRSKIRDSKLPPNAASNLNGMQTQGQLRPGGAALGRRFSGFRKKSDASSPTETQAVAFVPTPIPADVERELNQMKTAQSPQPDIHNERSYEPSIQESLSRVDTNDAHEANAAFSSFDQGPLDDIPAFIPDSPVNSSPRHSEDAAIPPSIPRYNGKISPATVAEPAPQLFPASDRWAQIRKNAAERAAQRQSEEQSHGGHSAATDNDGETSGEETIESRVARIKARVAELTGNMDTTAPSPVLRR